MTVTAGDIVVTGCATLLDASARAWPLAERIGYLNEAIRATVFVKPDAYPVRGVIPLVAGIVQVLPADGVGVIDITHNTTGRKRAVTVVDLAMLQEANRFWPAATQQAEVEHFAVDPRDPRRFNCFPPNDGTGSIFGIYGGTPAALTATTDALPLPDSYQAPLTAYVLSRCYEKNSKRQDLAKSSMYRQQWGQALGLKSQGQIATVPHVASSPGM